MTTTPRLILASQSASRAAMLKSAGVPFTAIPASIDERALEARMTGQPPEAIALALAEAKALAVARQQPDALVLGGDSLVTARGRRFDKPTTRAEAHEQLRWFSGHTVLLTSAAVLARDGAIIWRHGETAELQVRALSEAFITAYLDEEWPAVRHCVGAFRIEGRGVTLFEAITGGYHTVLGMPLLAVLAALRGKGVLIA